MIGQYPIIGTPPSLSNVKFLNEANIQFTIYTFFSSKIHEEDYRQIQTNAAFLAPEILSVFANSQIFHDNQPQLKKSSTQPTPIHGHSSREMDSDKLIMRLEGNRRRRHRIR